MELSWKIQEIPDVLRYQPPQFATEWWRMLQLTELTAKIILINVCVLSANVLSIQQLRKICRNGEEKPGCKNIFMWNSRAKTFTSAQNGTLIIRHVIENVLAGTDVRVVADRMPPYIFFDYQIQRLDGYLGQIWNVVEDVLEFKSNITHTNYDRGLQIISGGDSDVMLAAAVLKDGLTNIDYSQPYFYNWYHLYLRRPEARPQAGSYLRTLNNDLWIASGVTFVVLGTSMWFTIRFYNQGLADAETRVPFLNCMLAAISGFINQGFDINLQCLATRIEMFSSLIFGTMLYLSMNAVLVAQLAIFVLELPFNSLEDLGVQRTHSLCVRNNSFVYNDFVIKYSEENKTILPKWSKILNGKGCLDINNNENIDKIICNSGIVILENRAVMTTVLHRKPGCSITHLPTKLYTRSNHFLMLKSFKGKKIVTFVMHQLRSTGILERIEKQWVDQGLPSDFDNVVLPQVTMGHIISIVLILVAGILISVITLLIERIYYNYTRPLEFVK